MQYFGFDRPSFGIKTYGFGANFDPLTLFKDGKQGVWYDPSDITTLYQDAAGTVPVTKDGDPVALMRDKSGNNNHAVQSVSTSRPIYKTDGILHWLSLDGVDDFIIVSDIIFDGRAFTTAWGLSEKTTRYGGFQFVGASGVHYQEYSGMSTGLFTSQQTNYQRVGWIGGVQENNVRPSTLSTPFVSYARNGDTFRRGNVPASAEKDLGFMDFRLSPVCTLNIGKGYLDNVGHMSVYGFMWIDSDINNESMESVKSLLSTKSGVTL